MKQYRLNRLFNSKSNRCFIVAIDHGYTNEYSFLKGIEDIKKAIEIVVEAAPDAIQLNIGQAPYIQSIPGKEKPALSLRTDITNVYRKQLPEHLFSRMIDHPVEQALNLDAAVIVVYLFEIPNQPVVTDHCIQNILKLKPECDRFSMPLIVEPLVFKIDEKKVAIQ